MHPTTAFSLSSANSWAQWDGLTKTISLSATTTVMATYLTSSNGGSNHILSKMYVDNAEQVSTRSIMGNTDYATNVGIYAGSLAAGSHTFTVYYRTPGSITMASGGSDWQTRALNVVELPGATAYVDSPTDAQTLNSANSWTAWPGLSRTISLSATTTVFAWYLTSTGGGDNHILSKMYVDSAEQTQTRSINGNTDYATNFGMYSARLSAGSHTFQAYYRTPGSITFSSGGSDWQCRTLGIITLADSTDAPTPAPSAPPTATPTPTPTAQPTPVPTPTPTEHPTTRPPSPSPSHSPTEHPTRVPTPTPTDQPTQVPTPTPTATPTQHPTTLPPTLDPTSPTPSRAPTERTENCHCTGCHAHYQTNGHIISSKEDCADTCYRNVPVKADGSSTTCAFSLYDAVSTKCYYYDAAQTAGISYQATGSAQFSCYHK